MQSSIDIPWSRKNLTQTTCSTSRSSSASKAYTAKDIEVLEGTGAGAPAARHVYRRHRQPTRYHHLAAEILDNSMDEAVANHASRIELELKPGNVLVVRDNGRGIPIDPHPKFKNKSALEVIMTTLHAGGKVRRQGL